MRDDDGGKRRALSWLGASLLVVGAWISTAAYAAPASSSHEVETALWRETSSFSYAVAVTRSTTRWPEGTLLPMGEPAYFRSESGSVLVEHAWLPDAPEDARGVAASELRVLVEARDRMGRPYWSVSHPLDQATTQDLAAGVHVAGRVDMDRLVNEVATLNRELPAGEGALNWSVRATIVWSVESAGERTSGESVYELPFLVDDPRFVLPAADALQEERPHTRGTRVTVASVAGWPGVLRSLKGPLLLAAGALALGAAGIYASREEGAGFDRELRRYRDWVSVAHAVPAARDSTLVDVASLEDLVHVASDARTRVLLDDRLRVFYALLPGVTYRYARHATTPDDVAF